MPKCTFFKVMVPQRSNTPVNEQNFGKLVKPEKMRVKKMFGCKMFIYKSY